MKINTFINILLSFLNFSCWFLIISGAIFFILDFSLFISLCLLLMGGIIMIALHHINDYRRSIEKWKEY